MHYSRYMRPQYVCVYCETEVFNGKVCYKCHEYKSVMTIDAWEAYTGEKW